MGHLTLELITPAAQELVLLLGDWMVKTNLGSRLHSRMMAMARLAHLVILTSFRALMLMAMVDMMVMDRNRVRVHVEVQ